ncbi:tigger transposable element-derived protein 1-like [Scylla paramamosain]|uniref:tigger transposable element-derived protein 1-like n=1 Tax=Scylla paramamosain TaxID=85552 RepID=UPI003082C3B2
MPPKRSVSSSLSSKVKQSRVPITLAKKVEIVKKHRSGEKRANLLNIRIQNEDASADTEAAKKCPEEITRIIEEGGYSPKQVFNLDETALLWKKMPSQTYISREENSTRTQSKQGLPDIPFWTTSQTVLPFMKRYTKANNLDNKYLLILDNAQSSKNIGRLMLLYQVCFSSSKYYCYPATYGSGCNSHFQGTSHLTVYEAACDGKMTVKEFWKNFNIKHALEIIKFSWDEITPSNMNGVWKNLCPACVHSLKGFTKKELPAVHKQIASLAKDVGFEKVDDMADLFTSHTQELTGEELFHLEKHCESDSEGAPVAKEFTIKQLREIIDDGRCLAEKAIEFDPQFDRALDFKSIIMDGLRRYEKLQQKKASAVQKIRDFFKPKSSPSPSTSSSTNGLPSYFKIIKKDVDDPAPISSTKELPSSLSDQGEAGRF